ncbi:MAG: hypothetical protein AAGG72_01810, partial [Pseudomonadota bacterium]
MSDQELVGLLNTHETNATGYYESELSAAQAENMRRFTRQPIGDEQEHSSKAQTHDVEDTLNWVMPHLTRIVADRDDLFAVDEETMPGDDPRLKVAADYVRHVFFRENPGETLSYDFIFDGLLQKVGIFRVQPEGKRKQPPIEMRNVGLAQIQQLEQDPSVEIIGQQPAEGSQNVDIVSL